MPETIKVTAENPFVVRDPAFSVVNFLGPAGEAPSMKDFREIGQIFDRFVSGMSENLTPTCDVLFVYCDLGPSTEIAGSKINLRQLMIGMRARIVVVASETPTATLMAPTFMSSLIASRASWPANIIFIGNRNDPHVGPFFRSLFQLMFDGLSMLVAWNKLAPQIPGIERKDVPGCLFLSEVGHIVFARDPTARPRARATPPPPPQPPQRQSWLQAIFPRRR